MTVDALLTQDGDLGAVVERRQLLEQRVGEHARRVEPQVVVQAAVLVVGDALELLQRALGTVTQRLHAVRRLGPLLLQRRARRTPQERTPRRDAHGLVVAARRDAADRVDRRRGDARADEDLREGGDVGLADLEDGAELLVEEGRDGVVVLLERVDHDLDTDAPREAHLDNGREKTAVRAVVVREDLVRVLGANLAARHEERLEDLWTGVHT